MGCEQRSPRPSAFSVLRLYRHSGHGEVHGLAHRSPLMYATPTN
jgi:hypothetical protein